MLANSIRLCGWLLYTLAAMAIGWPFCVSGLILEHTAGVYEFIAAMFPVIAIFGLIAMVCFLLGKGCFWLSRRMTKSVS